jgi:hypothetical protein
MSLDEQLRQSVPLLRLGLFDCSFRWRISLVLRLPDRMRGFPQGKWAASSE